MRIELSISLFVGNRRPNTLAVDDLLSQNIF